MVFCDCSQGLLVPWESTVAEPEAAAAPPPPGPPPIPVLEPVSFPEEPPPLPRRERGRRRDSRQPASIDPNFCFNHPDTALHARCSDCHEPFCKDCLVVLQGITLCGPCKNLRIRTMQTPARASGWAVASLIVALMSCFFVCIVPVAGPTGGLFVLVPQLAAFALGLMGLRDTETRAKVSGQWLALTGMITAVVFALITVAIMIMAPALDQRG